MIPKLMVIQVKNSHMREFSQTILISIHDDTNYMEESTTSF
jgi:hypothetical protein